MTRSTRGLSATAELLVATLGEMTDADKAMNPQHYGIDPADIRIRIRINPVIWIRIPKHSRLTFHLGGVCTH